MTREDHLVLQIKLLRIALIGLLGEMNALFENLDMDERLEQRIKDAQQALEQTDIDQTRLFQ